MLNVLHVFALHKKLCGYTIRSHYIMKYQRKAGLNVGYISIEDDVLKPLNNIIPDKSLKYHKVKDPLYILLKNYYYKRFLKEVLIHKLRRFKPNIIHVHSPWKIGMDTIKIIGSINVKIPIIYEVRGLWEETSIALGGTTRRSLLYLLAKRQEKYVLKNVDAVVSISEHLRGYLLNRGVGKNKIVVIPNGVDTQFFKPLPKNRELMRKLAISSEDIVIGYIGSIRKIEGLDLLIEAIKREQFHNIKLIIVGEGESKYELAYKVRTLKLEGVVRLLKSVQHEDILKYYSILDIFVIPRKKFYVNELVTPLKPLEAMSMKKCVIASDVGGLKELIRDGVTGLLFKADNVEDLIEKIGLAITDEGLRERLGKNARKRVEKYRDWKYLVNNFIDLYNSLI